MTEISLPASADKPPRLTASPRPRCITVDDDPNSLKLIEMICSRALPGTEIVEFPGAVAALEFFRRHGATLIVTDVRMPVMDGLEFTAAIRAADTKVPIVVLSSDEVGADALAHGANVFLVKSRVVAELGAVLAKYS